MSSLMERLKKASSVDKSSRLSESTVYLKSDMAPTRVPMVNAALSGDLDGGISKGILVIAGPSRHFKTGYALLMAKAYLDKHEDAVMLFYDSEFGSPQSYFESTGIDPDRVFHTPIVDVEQLREDISKQLMNGIGENDKVIIVIDSVGNLASRKETRDAVDGKESADMTRAKTMKSLFRIVTPHVNLKDIPVVAIAHTYDTMEIYSKKVVSGGTGITYSADDVWIVGRQQEKDGTEILGYNFIINIDKSRFVKEKSKFPVRVTYEGGVDRYSGIFDLAVDAGIITRPSKVRYQKSDPATGEVDEKQYTRSQIEQDVDFMEQLIDSDRLKEHIASVYKLPAHRE